MKLIKIAIVFSFCFILNLQSESILIKAAKNEMNRSMQELGKLPNAPYYIAYSVSDIKKVALTSSFGKIESSNSDLSRIFDIDLRVGTYQFDNTHIIRGNPFDFSGGGGFTELPMEDNETAIRNIIWQTTDRQYKSAIERLEKAQTNQKVKVDEEDKSADMSKEKPVIYTGSKPKLNFDKSKIEDMLRRLSARFAKENWLYDGSVNFNAEEIEKTFINTEGSELVYGEAYVRMFVYAKTKSDDGMSLPLYKSYFSYSVDGLPKEEQIAKDIDELIDLLKKLRNAPLMTTFTGPAILSGEASGVFFHEIFGHRVEGHREKDPNSSQTFKQSIDKKIFPEFISVTFDPTIKVLKNREISGFYEYDDEGVKGQKVNTVENGFFKNFLMSRSPIDKFNVSNGHGRKQAGYKAVSRQSNLVVNTTKSVPFNELKQKLVTECKKQNKDYGLYFVTVQGGFTFTSRTIPNAFNVTPLVVYKIFADGRADELVRGVDLIGTPLSTFANIIESADDLGVFNGVCGAESGGVYVAACSPSLLVSTIEVQKKKKSQAKPPILNSPVGANP